MKTVKKVFEIRNYRQIKVGFLAPTNYRGARIKIYEPKRYNDDKTQSKVFSYDYRISDTAEQAYQILIRNGFNVVCRASEFKNYIFMCDNWADDFKEVNNLK